MIRNDEEFKGVLKEYLKSKDVNMNDKSYRRICKNLKCKDCVLKDVEDGLYNACSSLCEEKPFQEIEKCEKKIDLLRKEIDIMNKWNEKNDVLPKETRDEVEKTYHTIQNLTAKMFRLYKELDQMKNGEEK